MVQIRTYQLPSGIRMIQSAIAIVVVVDVSDKFLYHFRNPVSEMRHRAITTKNVINRWHTLAKYVRLTYTGT